MNKTLLHIYLASQKPAVKSKPVTERIYSVRDPLAFILDTAKNELIKEDMFLINGAGEAHKVTAMLDTGCQANAVNKNLLKKLKLQKIKTNQKTVLFGVGNHAAAGVWYIATLKYLNNKGEYIYIRNLPVIAVDLPVNMDFIIGLSGMRVMAEVAQR